MIKIYINFEYYCTCENKEELNNIIQSLDLNEYGIIEIEYE